MSIYSERKRLREISEHEAEGENLWSTEIPDALRNKVDRYVSALNTLLRKEHGYDFDGSVKSYAFLTLSNERGLREPPDTRSRREAAFDSYFINGDDEEFPDVLETLYSAAKEIESTSKEVPLYERFEQKVNDLLESYRVSYTLENGEIVDFESRALHVEVVKPALTLLANSQWKLAEEPFREAIREISNTKYDDAITDATTALQEGLRLAGCTGKDFSALKKSAKATVLNGYDGKYLDAIERLIDWSSASRVNRGDSHKTAKATSADAWLVLHTVGALLLWLTKQDRK